MRVTRHDLSKAVVDNGRIFIGEVRRQPFVSDNDAELLRVNSVTFTNGARNKFHRHSCDQVLIVTHGKGLIVNEGEQKEIEAGDVVLIPAGEKHWHGALPDGEMTHFSILTPSQLDIEE